MTNQPSPLIKICGLSTPDSVACAQANGATHLGFIFFPKSPRNVTPDQARDLTASAGAAKTVAVSVDAKDDFLNEIVEVMQPDMLQLHGGETVDRVQAIQQSYGLPVIKALAIRDASDLEKARAYDGVADMLLLDAKPPKGSDLPGGNGVSFDWQVLDGFTSTTPVLLSGGIDVASAPDAMARVRDATNSLVGIDVSSSVESQPGVKDDTKIKALLAACHAG